MITLQRVREIAQKNGAVEKIFYVNSDMLEFTYRHKNGYGFTIPARFDTKHNELITAGLIFDCPPAHQYRLNQVRKTNPEMREKARAFVQELEEEVKNG